MAAFEIRRIAVDNVDFDAVVAPIDCDNVTLEGEQFGFKVRSSVGDPTTELTRLVGTQEYINGHRVSRNSAKSRFKVGDTVCHVKSLGASDTIVARFIGAIE